MGKTSIEKIAENDIIEVVDKKANKTTTFDIKTNIRNIVKKIDALYFQNGENLNSGTWVHENSIYFAFKVVDINEEYITIETNPMCEIKDEKINLNDPQTKFNLTKNSKLRLHTPNIDEELEFELMIKKRELPSNKQDSTLENYIEKISKKDNNNYDSNDFLCGIFIDIMDKQALKIYSYDYYNKKIDKDNSNIEASKPTSKPIPEEIATNWIIKQTNFKIISETLYICHGNLHDEKFYVETEEIKENFGYSPNITYFKCEKDGKEFILIPTHEDIKINNDIYFIPAIQIQNNNPESLGLTNIRTLNLEYSDKIGAYIYNEF